MDEHQLYIGWQIMSDVMWDRVPHMPKHFEHPTMTVAAVGWLAAATKASVMALMAMREQGII